MALGSARKTDSERERADERVLSNQNPGSRELMNTEEKFLPRE